MNKLFEGLKKESNKTLTENDALSNKSTLNHVLDFFGQGGALRTRDESEIIRIFSKAYVENPLLALKCLFYLRDIRSGQGERRTFRIILKYLSENYHDTFLKNFNNVPEFGRWDDLFVGIDTTYVMNWLKQRLEWDLLLFCKNGDFLFPWGSDFYTKNEIIRKRDFYGKEISLLAKWMPSINAGKKSKVLAKKFIKSFGWSEREYRQTLSNLRKHLKIVESKMCANEWDKIEFDNIPSKAGMIYSKAFRKHQKKRYQEFLESVKKGEKKINTKAIFPYEILRRVKMRDNIDALTVMWDNLPDYCVDGEENSIVVCDTSGSMKGMPMDVSTSLAMYFAERNKGVWKNHFITFSQSPEFQKIVGSNLYEKYINLNNAAWNQNTNLTAVFELILRIAKENEVPEKDMLKKIYIVSDMEFDSATRGSTEYFWNNLWDRRRQTIAPDDKTNFHRIEEMYREAGYERPLLVFWNVDSRNDQNPITINDDGVYLVSGCSPTIFKNLMQSKTRTAIDLMLEVLNSERYSKVMV